MSYEKKVFLKILQNSQENTCTRASILRKLQASACNFIKKETLAHVFSCKFCKIFRNTFFTEHLWTNNSIPLPFTMRYEEQGITEMYLGWSAGEYLLLFFLACSGKPFKILLNQSFIIRFTSVLKITLKPNSWTSSISRKRFKWTKPSLNKKK